MLKNLTLLVLLAFSSCCLFSQNIVPDPGFEDWDGTIGQNPNTLGGLNLWYEVNGTPDHHHINNPPGNNLTSLDTTCATGSGQNQCGFPCEGLATLGTYKANGESSSKEWSAIELSTPMEAGKTYNVSMSVQNKKDNPSFLMETNQWGIFFSEEAQPSFDPNTADFSTMTNQFVTCQEVISGSDWIDIEWEYECDAGYTHIFVGYVGNVADATTNAWSDSGSVGFYVWMDKISVVEQIQTSVEKQTEDDVTVYPVPANQYIKVDLGGLSSKETMAAIFNSHGQKIRDVIFEGTQVHELDISDLSPGNYSIAVEGLERPLRFIKQ